MTTIPDDVKVSTLQLGAEASPQQLTGGSGAMVSANKGNGSIHLRSDTDTVPEVKHNNAIEKMGFAQHAIECRLPALVANQANVYTTYMPRNAKITGVSRRYSTKPSSTSGTVVAGITIDGNAILASGSEDEEGLSNDTLTAHALTGTAANLLVSKGEKVVITITSNNADMTGGVEGLYYIYYEDN